jgi:hypothetical protein
MNETSRQDFEALAPGVCWYYNWHYRPKCRGASAGIQFIPMVWGGKAKKVPPPQAVVFIHAKGRLPSGRDAIAAGDIVLHHT